MGDFHGPSTTSILATRTNVSVPNLKPACKINPQFSDCRPPQVANLKIVKVSARHFLSPTFLFFDNRIAGQPSGQPPEIPHHRLL